MKLFSLVKGSTVLNLKLSENCKLHYAIPDTPSNILYGFCYHYINYPENQLLISLWCTEENL